MQYDLSNPLDKERFKSRVNQLYVKKAVVDLTEKVFKTPNQNKYLHLLIGVVAMDTGNSVEYCKQEYFKRLVNPQLFVRKHWDRLAGEVATLRSITELTKEEISESIDRFKRWGDENGFIMPNPGDRDLLRAIEVEMGRQRIYL